MDAGFTAIIDRPSVTFKNSDRLILFRYPKQVDIATFKNVHIDLSERDVVCPCGENQYNFLIDKSATVDSNFRPLEGSATSVNATIGRQFAESITVLRKLSFDLQNDSIGSEVTPAYSKVPQLDFLQVRSVPTGSISSVDEINDRKRLNIVPSSKSDGHEKKRAKTTTETVSDIDSKKQKKNKKDKVRSS